MVLESTSSLPGDAPYHIKHWAEEDRPREKLVSKGRAAVSDAELLAILLRSGTASLSAVELAKRILREANNSLAELASFTIEDLLKIKGVGQAKATAIVAALELGRRRRGKSVEYRPLVHASRAAFNVIKPNLQDLDQEQFWVILLKRGNRVIKKCLINIGGLGQTEADPKVIFKLAIDERASAIILAHNHPSGSPLPSNDDIMLTRKIKAAGKLLDMQVLDHIIVAGEKYFSFADGGML